MTTTPMSANGQGTLFELDWCPTEKSIADPSPRSTPTTSEDSDKCISSAEFSAGPTPSNWPDGPQTDLFGRAPAPASPSPPQANKAEALTSGISGLSGFGSSASVALTLSLVSKLQERLASAGSIEYAQTWKRLVTPAGRRYWAHTASARRTSGNACSGWRSPASQESGITLDRLITKDGEPWTPGQRAYDRETGRMCETGLAQQALLAGWATPSAQEFGATAETTLARRERVKAKHSNGNGFGLTLGQTAAFYAGWPTPNTPSGGRSISIDKMDATGKTADGRKHTASLEHAAKFAGWITPQAHDVSGRSQNQKAKHGTKHGCAELANQVPGVVPPGSPASTARPGALNPAFSLWLQGYPPQWMALAPSAASASSKAPEMLSSRKLRQSSSAP